MTFELKNEYNWTTGFGASLDINKVIKELYDIQSRDGEISPEAIVKEARQTHSVLHSYFEWNNTKAADKYRLQQATALLSRIEVKVIKDGEPKTIRAFEITNRGVGEKSYASFNLSDGAARAKETSLTDLKRVLTRLTAYEQYATIVPQIKKAIKDLSKLSTETKKEKTPVLLATAS